MILCLILVKIKNSMLFADYVDGHLPTVSKFGGKIIFRSIENSSVLGTEQWDVVVIQEWPSDLAFDLWWNSEDYQPWTKIRDNAASMIITKCQNTLPILPC
jgi:uncharacterized protein (DUF1330 family)